MICLVKISKVKKFIHSKPRKLRAVWTVEEPNLGMVYGEDYSDKFIKRTLVDRVYVTGYTGG